ncbi:GNAT family N-acetyltransferase [Alkaliphilus transvaalensis]|uniref:GNAT family N-acetyltransferase n=1 Tax=Alkaliphilus transvaalensis TaxID=114628 RepID=UPI00047DC38B|nr:GNAT family N-acetyltransferase [Alkaliphilus transvaalensis]
MNEINKEFLKNNEIILERANSDNVDLLIQWTLDPVAQGPYKIVPNVSKDQLKTLFLNNKERHYFLIKDKFNRPIGRFYYREWKFDRDIGKIDWELNIFIANPDERGKGYGTAAQSLVIDYLKRLKETKSIFAYTMTSNIAEQKSLEKCEFKFMGNLPNKYYKIDLDGLNPNDFVLFVIDNFSND